VEKWPISWGLCPQAGGNLWTEAGRSVVVVVDDGLLPERVGGCDGDPCEEDQDGRNEKELADGGDPTVQVHLADKVDDRPKPDAERD